MQQAFKPLGIPSRRSCVSWGFNSYDTHKRFTDSTKTKTKTKKNNKENKTQHDSKVFTIKPRFGYYLQGGNVQNTTCSKCSSVIAKCNKFSILVFTQLQISYQAQILLQISPKFSSHKWITQRRVIMHHLVINMRIELNQKGPNSDKTLKNLH